MTEQEEKLWELKNQQDSLKIPADIDDYILKGIKKVKKKRFYTRWGTVAAAFAILLFLTMIRVSPTFAEYVNAIPGLEKIVELARFDKGLVSAIENEFMQPIGVSQEHQGITISIDSVIMDEEQMVLFYTITSDRNRQKIDLHNPKLLDENNRELEASMSHSPIIDEFEKNKPRTNKINFYFHEPVSEKMTLSLQVIADAEQLDAVWQIPFTVDKAKFAGLKQEFEINEQVSIEGQQIIFEKMTVLPTRIGVHIRFPAENSMKIFAFDDLSLVDENGEIWGTVINGISASLISENERIFHFQSNYFDKPKELYLQFSSVRALPKDQLQVVVDVAKQQIIKAPADGQLQKVELRGHELVFFMETGEDPFQQIFDFDFRYKDANEKEYKIKSAFVSSSNEPHLMQEYGYTLQNLTFKNPLTFTLNDYPHRLVKDVRIKLK